MANITPLCVFRPILRLIKMRVPALGVEGVGQSVARAIECVAGAVAVLPMGKLDLDIRGAGSLAEGQGRHVAPVLEGVVEGPPGEYICEWVIVSFITR